MILFQVLHCYVALKDTLVGDRTHFFDFLARGSISRRLDIRSRLACRFDILMPYLGQVGYGGTLSKEMDVVPPISVSPDAEAYIEADITVLQYQKIEHVKKGSSD